MYGLLLENLATFIKAQWGEGKWESVRRHSGIDIAAFSIHHVYPETLLRLLARSAFQVLGVDERQFFEDMGVYFVQYVSQYGYDQLLTVLGRHMRDFLNGLDNLHEYLKFSYPKMRAPSFYCDDETESGLKLHYRSKRRGFVYYVMGQIKQVAKQFYNQDCQIELLKEEVVGETMHVVFQLTFDNSAFTEAEAIKSLIGKDLRLPFSATTLFELFPFCIVFNSDMEISHTGHTDLVGQIMTEAFDMTRPLIPFCFSAIMQRRNNIFELVTVAPIHDVSQVFGTIENFDEDMEGTRLRLRGQMLYMEDWDMMLYLANPVMPDLTSLVDAGLFINDLSLHDCSRDLVLAGTQQSVELKLALDQEQQKSRKLVQSMKKLDEEMRRTDELLYQMIPKQVADRIRRGDNPADASESFDSVSILFSQVCNFTEICGKITPLEVVSMLNHMYFLFDQLTERNGVYKVETIGDSYMGVCGAPIGDFQHAERICDLALDMMDSADAILDPSEGEDYQKGLKLRIGCHTGSVIAGVVGVKLPRYCLFGESVNTASKMESFGEPGRVQISEATKNLLPGLYRLELRGTVSLKNKMSLNTYWLKGREARVPLSKNFSKSLIWAPPSNKILEGIRRPASPTVVDGNGLDIGIQRPSVPENLYGLTQKSTISRENLLRRFTTSKLPGGGSIASASYYGGRFDRRHQTLSMPSMRLGNYSMNRNKILEPGVPGHSCFGTKNVHLPDPVPISHLVDEILNGNQKSVDNLDTESSSSNAVVGPAHSDGAEPGTSKGTRARKVLRRRRQQRRHPLMCLYSCMYQLSDSPSEFGSDRALVHEDERAPQDPLGTLHRTGSADTGSSALSAYMMTCPEGKKQMSRSCSLM